MYDSGYHSISGSGHLEDLRESSGCTSGSQTKETGKVLKKNFTKVSADRKVMHSKMFEVQTEGL